MNEKLHSLVINFIRWINGAIGVPVIMILVMVFGSILNEATGLGSTLGHAAGSPVADEPWQWSIVLVMFGYQFVLLLLLLAVAHYYQAAGTRRFRSAIKAGQSGSLDYGLGYYSYSVAGDLRVSSRFAP